MTDSAHVPVLLDRVVALLAPALDRPGSVLVDATLGLGGHTRGGARALPGGLGRGSRPRPGGAAAGRRPAGRLRGAYDARPRGLRRDPAGARESRAVQRRRRAVRPRGLLAAARPGATAASRTRRTPRSTCGWTAARASRPPRSSTPTPPPTWRASCAGTARSGSPGRSPRGSWRSAGRAPFDTSARLVELIRAAIPAAARRTGGNPAKRTFQALRIEVNDELAVLERALPRAVDALALGGRIVVMSYHSLEDRLAKRALVVARHVDRAAGPAGRTRRAPARAAPAHPGRRAGLRRGDRRQPTRRLRAAPCSRTHPGGRVSTSVNPNRSRVSLAGISLPRPRLTVVPRAASRAPRLPFLVLVVAVLATGLVGLLLLNTSMERGAYQVTALRAADRGARHRAAGPAAARSRRCRTRRRSRRRRCSSAWCRTSARRSSQLATGQVIGHSWAGAAGNQPDIGAKVGPSVDRLAKIAPVIAGEGNNAGTTVVQPGAEARDKSRRHRGDVPGFGALSG